MTNSPPPAEPKAADRESTYWIQSLDLAIWMVRLLRKLVVLIVGLSVVLAGVVMIVAPGPAFITIPVGLAILATEFIWARRLLNWAKDRLRERLESLSRKDSPP